MVTSSAVIIIIKINCTCGSCYFAESVCTIVWSYVKLDTLGHTKTCQMEVQVVMKETKEPEQEEEPDPGIIIKLADVHACLLLLPTIPPINVGFPVAPALAAHATNPVTSLKKITTWLDSIMQKISPSCILGHWMARQHHAKNIPQLHRRRLSWKQGEWLVSLHEIK